MPQDTEDTGDDSTNEPAGKQADLSPWESPHRSASDTTTSHTSDDLENADESNNDETTDSTNDSDGNQSENENKSGSDSASNDSTTSSTASLSFGDIDWERRELGDSYPADANYHCNECNDFHCESVRELKTHVEEDEDLTWGEYLAESGLHRCAGCGDALSSLADLYCEDCTQGPDDRIPCRNCGAVRVNISDPFCTAGCAGQRIAATDGPPDPLSPAKNPSDDWLDHPHRLPAGIPSAAPFIENHQLACRECYEYGADSLHKFAVHVSERHDFGWAGYINKYALRRCRVCETPLESLLPLYCSGKCQRSDPDPVKKCKRRGCDAAVERRQKYCSRDCYRQDTKSL